MALITKKHVMDALKQAAIMAIGTPLLLIIPVIGALLAGIPTSTIGPVVIAWGNIVAGAAALIAGNLLLEKLGM